jgi:hypothetical protein
MEHPQEAIKEFHNRLANKQRKCDEDITFPLVGEEIAQMYHVKL